MGGYISPLVHPWEATYPRWYTHGRHIAQYIHLGRHIAQYIHPREAIYPVIHLREAIYPRYTP